MNNGRPFKKFSDIVVLKYDSILIRIKKFKMTSHLWLFNW